MIRHLFITLLLSMLLACSGPQFPKTNSDPAKNNTQTFNQDLKDCLDAYPEASSGSYIKQRISCMNLKGWH
ncbi:hypothetical protein G6708_07845 [Polynucleobacter paneuropaeus]|nr:hypothetical protein [Polynucleobacter paneuropaeus]QWD39046.1 hypothetical protein G6669_01545 [Polynucleobacter paneuropaeus]